MHSRRDGAGGIFQTDRRSHDISPVPHGGRIIASAHAVGFVAELPVFDRRAIFEFADETADKAHLPFQGERIGKDIQSLQCGREEQSSAHPTGDDPHDQINFVFGCDFRQNPEPADHLLIDSGASAGCIGQKATAETDSFCCAIPSIHEFDRLEILPVGENPDHVASDFRQTLEILSDDLLIPSVPHICSRMRCPVIAAYFHCKLL